MAHILVVDDDKLFLKVLETALQNAGHTVETADDGYAAIERLNRELFELLITDANMPAISGFNLVATLRKIEKFENLPVMFVTGRRDKADVVRALKAGVDDYIVKPIDTDIFLAKVESLLLNKKGARTFKDTPISAGGTWTADIKILGLSEQGLTATMTGALPVNFKLQIQSELYDDIGINNPQLRVVSCEADPDDKRYSLIKFNFIGLTEGEHQSIRRYLMSKRTQAA